MYSEREIVKVKGAKKCNNRLQFYLFCKSSFVRRSSKVCTVTDKTLHDLFMKIIKKKEKKLKLAITTLIIKMQGISWS